MMPAVYQCKWSSQRSLCALMNFEEPVPILIGSRLRISPHALENRMPEVLEPETMAAAGARELRDGRSCRRRSNS